MFNPVNAGMTTKVNEQIYLYRSCQEVRTPTVIIVSQKPYNFHTECTVSSMGFLIVLQESRPVCNPKAPFSV